MSSLQGFAHRRNPDDETFDSICCSCFATVGAHKQEKDLEWIERGHVCDPWAIERFQQKDPHILTMHDHVEHNS